MHHLLFCVVGGVGAIDVVLTRTAAGTRVNKLAVTALAIGTVLAPSYEHVGCVKLHLVWDVGCVGEHHKRRIVEVKHVLMFWEMK
eukprot:CAMPEP_0175098126 /NCGR_PEP_ID=MMETSP0086_2-20121207/5669_1 /TAXON_ID=136419 /ORGANISM="Unknown Unknown, Strain D1" /LENGTH=84 /DNA_ID=CAMNT_0016371713 /DNA_START=1198 /DNA_END=1449 /DNA_ORIENTATION=+